MSLRDLLEITLTSNTVDDERDYVAIGNLIDQDNYAHHSALVIKYKEEVFQFEFTGTIIKFQRHSDNFYQKNTYVIHEGEIPAFISYCNTIRRNSNPRFGLFYSGSLYDDNGDYIGGQPFGERMTCVGFCLNVLGGFLGREYMQYTDWNYLSVGDQNYLRRFCDRHSIDMEQVRSAHRQISPRELFVSAFYRQLPITKNDIESKLESVVEYFDARLSVGN